MTPSSASHTALVQGAYVAVMDTQGTRVIVHLAASPFVGGPERQMLGLAANLPATYRSVFLAFADGGSSRALLDEVRGLGIEGVMLKHDAPRYGKAIREVADELCRWKADVLCCHGYKPDILGWRAARRAGCKVVSVSHGWTAATWKVRLNETLDRWALRWMDRVVCVSASQADKVEAAGVEPAKVVVIRNAVTPPVSIQRDVRAKTVLADLGLDKARWLIGAAGRLSPEKGFDQLVDAAALVCETHPDARFVLFGRGPLQASLEKRIAANGLKGKLVLGGFRTDLDRFWPSFDLAVLPSHTEGLPVMVLEALGAGVPVVATAVGGTPEVVRDGVDGYLTAASDSRALAERIRLMLNDDSRRKAMGQAGRERVVDEFSFTTQADRYQELFEEMLQVDSIPASGRQGLTP